MSNFSKSCNNKVHIVSIYKIVDWQLAGGGGSKVSEVYSFFHSRSIAISRWNLALHDAHWTKIKQVNIKIVKTKMLKYLIKRLINLGTYSQWDVI